MTDAEFESYLEANDMCACDPTGMTYILSNDQGEDLGDAKKGDGIWTVILMDN